MHRFGLEPKDNLTGMFLRSSLTDQRDSKKIFLGYTQTDIHKEPNRDLNQQVFTNTRRCWFFHRSKY